MRLELKGLIMDKNSGSLDELEACLKPDVEFEYLDLVTSIHKALEYHMEMDFQLCLIADTFPVNEVNSFLRDYDKLQKNPRCIFVQYKNTVDLDFNRDSLVSYGITTVISKTGDHKDKTALWNALKPLISKFEKKEIADSLDTMIDHLLTEVDRVAQDRKRGVTTKLHSVWGQHIADSSKKYEGLDQDFYNKLIKSTNESEPFSVTEIEVPEAVLGKNLPHLSKSNYKGRSNRVWNMLLNKHGIGAEKEPVPPPPPPPEQGPEEPSESPSSDSEVEETKE